MRGADTRSAFSGLFDLYVPVAAGVFAVVVLALALILVRDRARAGRAPSRRASAPRLELAYAIGLGLIAAFLLWRSFTVLHRVDGVVAHAAPAPRAGSAGLTIGVVAAKWNWRFTYPGGVVEQGDGPRRLPTLVVPAGQPVRFRLTSLDVVHAFWIPAARFKYDAIPGRANVFDLVFDPGIDYRDDRCSEFCGQYHEQMRFRVAVKAPAAFREWLAARQGAAGTSGA
ncbi:MAG: ctaC2 [Conexibacter sp.]|nr:ctaC2 [Conexibacter sp.]